MCHGQIVGSKIRTARSDRGLPCAICGRPIVTGAVYVHHAIMAEDDGAMTNWKLCRRCAEMWDSWWAEHDGGYCPMDLRGELRERVAARGWRAWRASMRRSWGRMRGEAVKP